MCFILKINNLYCFPAKFRVAGYTTRLCRYTNASDFTSFAKDLLPGTDVLIILILPFESILSYKIVSINGLISMLSVRKHEIYQMVYLPLEYAAQVLNKNGTGLISIQQIAKAFVRLLFDTTFSFAY
jgi:hypothetical protein